MFVLPVPREKVVCKTPWVIAIIAVIDALLLLPLFSGNSQQFLFRYGFIPSHPTLLTFFSGIFLHVGIWHYVGNMWFFYIFGRKVEATFGHLMFAAAYLVCGVGGQLLYWAFDVHSVVPCVGASGAISGIAAIYFVIYPKDSFDLQIYLGWLRVKTIASNARAAVGVWIAEQFILGLLASVWSFSSTAFWAHVGGFAMGAALGLLYCAQVVASKRPSFEMIELPDPDNIEQPSELIGLNLASGPIGATHASSSSEVRP